MFPTRYRELTLDTYPDLKGLRVRLNPTQAELNALADGPTFEPSEDETETANRREDARRAFGAALVQAYAGGKVEAYGVVLDFSTADAALATLENDALPGDLIWALRNAPIDLPIGERLAISKKLQAV
jgi:hypothetical protein